MYSFQKWKIMKDVSYTSVIICTCHVNFLKLLVLTLLLMINIIILNTLSLLKKILYFLWFLNTFIFISWLHVWIICSFSNFWFLITCPSTFKSSLYISSSIYNNLPYFTTKSIFQRCLSIDASCQIIIIQICLLYDDNLSNTYFNKFPL